MNIVFPSSVADPKQKFLIWIRPEVSFGSVSGPVSASIYKCFYNEASIAFSSADRELSNLDAILLQLWSHSVGECQQASLCKQSKFIE
jgi:hypothetical protein